MRNIPSVPPLIRDEVDEYIEAQKRLKEIEENDFEAIFDSPADSTKIDSAKIEMESTLKLAILGRLKDCSKDSKLVKWSASSRWSFRPNSA